MNWKNLDRYQLRCHAEQEHKLQIEAASGAALSNEPVMPPEGIDPLRWKAMVNSLKIALNDGNEDQIQ